MTQHTLQGRTDSEILWFRRRSFLAAAAAWSALGGFGAAQAQQRSNIVELQRRCPAQRPAPGAAADHPDRRQPGDRARLEPGVRDRQLRVPGAPELAPDGRTRATLNAVSVLRLLTGAVASVWGRGTSRQIVTPTLTAGIRGTGVYTEVFPQQDHRSYFCNCYGTVDIGAGRRPDACRSSEYHQSFWGEAEAEERPLPHAGQGHQPHRRGNGIPGASWSASAPPGRSPGSKGVKDGQGYMEQQPATAHPALQPR